MRPLSPRSIEQASARRSSSSSSLLSERSVGRGERATGANSALLRQRPPLSPLVVGGGGGEVSILFVACILKATVYKRARFFLPRARLPRNNNDARCQQIFFFSIERLASARSSCMMERRQRKKFFSWRCGKQPPIRSLPFFVTQNFLLSIDLIRLPTWLPLTSRLARDVDDGRCAA